MNYSLANFIFLFPATQRHVVCLALSTSGGLTSEGTPSLLENLSLQTSVILIPMDRGDPLAKDEHSPSNIE